MKKWLMSRIRTFLRQGPDFYYIAEEREFEQQLEENRLKRAV